MNENRMVKDDFHNDEMQTPIITKKIGNVTYYVEMHFDPDSKETLQDKLKRLLLNEINRSNLTS